MIILYVVYVKKYVKYIMMKRALIIKGFKIYRITFLR